MWEEEKMNQQTALVPGSIGAMAKQNNTSIAETFMSADAVIVVDTSGSMDTRDSRGGKTRYEVAIEELTQLQALMPGKLAVISFSSDVEFCPAGIAKNMGGMTDLAKALRFVHVADVPGIKFIVISDGQPDDEREALAVAKTFKNKINVIYVGPEEDPRGRDFLQRLAAATGGESITKDRAKELAVGVKMLLAAGR
jgi:Mg-chelatase subunit ChlD